MKFVFVAIAVMCASLSAAAEDASPIFGSASQEPILIIVDPATGLPLATRDVPQPIQVTSR
jgi:outer membrane receptor protein involved in Fe transport